MADFLTVALVMVISGMLLYWFRVIWASPDWKGNIMSGVSAMPVCPGCHQPTDPNINTCEHCGYIRLGRFAPGAPPPMQTPQTGPEPGSQADPVASDPAQTDDGSVPAGWYEDPHGGGQRYWDGQQWGQRWLNTGASQADPRNDSLAMIGWVTAILFPIVGLGVGIMLSGRNDRRGMPIAITAIVVFVAWIGFWIVLNVILANSVNSGY